MPKMKAEDRRVRRTRTLLQDALTALIIEKGYEKTTVQDIIDRADVGRATFYAHFADKQTLLVSGLEDLRSTLLRRQEESSTNQGAMPLRFSRAMLEHAASAVPLWRALAGADTGTFVVRRIHDMLAELARNDLETLGMTRATAHREMLVQHVTGAFMGAMTWWLDQGAKLSVDDMDATFQRLAAHGLSAELRVRSSRAGPR